MTDTADPPDRSLQMLYPAPGDAPLEGLYLSRDLRRHARADRCYVYSNFVTSLDGRIAVADRAGGAPEIPQDTANPRDWRLLLELAAPADAVIVSGRYVRQLADGTAQAEPPLQGDVPSDILDFRAALGLPAQPALVVVSNSLDLPVALADRLQSRAVIVVTSDGAGERAARRLTDAGIELVRAGDRAVDGRRLVDALARRGHRLVYSIAGPAVMHTLLEARTLHALYLTTVLRVLSGSRYATLAQGAPLAPAYDFELASMCLDPHGPDGVQQLLQVYRACRSPG